MQSMVSNAFSYIQPFRNMPQDVFRNFYLDISDYYMDKRPLSIKVSAGSSVHQSAGRQARESGLWTFNYLEISIGTNCGQQGSLKKVDGHH